MTFEGKKTALELFGLPKLIERDGPFSPDEIILLQLLNREQLEPSVAAIIGTMIQVADEGGDARSTLLETIPNIEIRELISRIVEERIRKFHEKKKKP